MYFKVIYKLALLLVLSAIALAITNVSAHIGVIVFRLVLFFFIFVEVTLLFKSLIIDSNIKEWLKKTGVVVYSLLFVFMLLESVFMFIPRSHGFGYSLAGKLWTTHFGGPINSYGFRGAEPKAGKNTVFFIGDSFTEGQGIDADERFSAVAQQNLGSTYNVINLGKAGYDTQKEYETLVDFTKKSKIKPGYLVLQYFGNDIDHAAAKHGVTLQGFEPYAELSFPAKVLVANSYVLNYFYLKFPKQDTLSHINYIKKAYRNDSIFSDHLNEVHSFIDYTKKENIKLLVTIFPFMEAVDSSKALFVDKLKLFLDSNKVEYIDVSPLVKNLPVKDRVVNLNDGHASAYVNKLVGEAVAERLRKM